MKRGSQALLSEAQVPWSVLRGHLPLPASIHLPLWPHKLHLFIQIPLKIQPKPPPLPHRDDREVIFSGLTMYVGSLVKSPLCKTSDLILTLRRGY